MRSRADDSAFKEEISKLGFIGSSSSIESQYTMVVSELTYSFINVNVYVTIICWIIILIVSIFSSRYLADTIMDRIITLCIKMKIAQISHAKIQKNNARNRKIEFSKSLFGTSNDPDSESKNEIDILFQEVEDIIKVINLRGFILTEANPKKYNKGALKEYYEVINMYKDTLDKIQNNGELSLLKKDSLVSHIRKVLCICYSNIGCILYSQRDYEKACKEFHKSSMLEDLIENEGIGEDNLPISSSIKLKMERSARRLNYCLALIKCKKNLFSKFSKEKDENPMMNTITAEIKLVNILNLFKGSSIYSEVEIFSICTLINCKLALSKIEECVVPIKHLIKVIEDLSQKDNPTLYEIASQYGFYLRAKCELEMLTGLIQSRSKPTLFRLDSFESGLSFPAYDNASIKTKSTNIRTPKNHDFRKRYKELFKEYSSNTAKYLRQALFSTKIIDPEVYRQTLSCFKDFNFLINKNSAEVLDRIENIFDFDKKWNLIICYNPKFVQNYNRSLNYLNIIKESLKPKDLLSIFIYDEDKLECIIDK